MGKHLEALERSARENPDKPVDKQTFLNVMCEFLDESIAIAKQTGKNLERIELSSKPQKKRWWQLRGTSDG